MLWAGSKNNVYSGLLLGLGRGTAVGDASFQCRYFPIAAAGAIGTGSGMAAVLGWWHVVWLGIGSPTSILHLQGGLRLAAVFGSKGGRGDCGGRRQREKRERNDGAK